MPFVVPNSTIAHIERDSTSPQARAYAWLKSNPYLSTYNSDRMLQRFVLACFYYSTGGEDWLHQGGDKVVIETDLGTNQGTLNQAQQNWQIYQIVIESKAWLSYEDHECNWFTYASLRNRSA